MIFSRIFSPAHTSSDPQKRLQAVAKLSPNKPSEKAALHELAFNDENADVALAALEKLDAFALWLKTSQIATDTRIRRYAEQKVEAVMVNGRAEELPVVEQKEYLRQVAPVDMVRKVLESGNTLLEDDEFTLFLLKKVGRQELTQRFFLNHASSALQQRIIEHIDDKAFLTRLVRKSDSEQVSQKLEQRIAYLESLATKPVEVERAATLALSKLQAVTERQDYEDVKARIDAAQRDFKALEGDFVHLSTETQAQLHAKHRRITDFSQRHLANLQTAWLKYTEEREAKQRWEDAQNALTVARKQVTSLYEERINEATLAEIEEISALTRQLEERIESLNNSHQTPRELATFRQNVASLAKSLDDFPAQQQFAAKALALLERLEKDTDDSQVIEQSEWTDVQGQWQQLTADLYVVPPLWRARWRKICELQQREYEAARSEEKQDIRACKKQMSIIRNFIDSGRFRAAMARFTDLERLYAQLPDSARPVLAKRFEKIQEDISRLEGWQSYIAEPRRPALLAEAKALAASTTNEIGQRAEAIRYLRQQWQSLGTAADEPELQAAFDQALEEAFSPCRDFYAQQEKQRAEAQRKRIRLIDEVNSLPAETGEEGLAKQLEQYKQKWRDAGQVEKKRYEALKEQWELAMRPHQERVNAWYQENKAHKQSLIAKAKALLDLEDQDEAASQAQQLQQQWKDIGNAGKRHETKLWQAFKETNDALFAGIKETRKARRQASSDAAQTLLSSLSDIESAVLKNHDDANLDDLLAPILTSVDSLDKKNASIIRQRIQALHKAVDTRRDAHKQKKAIRAVTSLRSVLGEWSKTGEISNGGDWQELTKSWQQAIESVSPSQYSRSWIATTLEVSLSLATPDALAEERTSVQLALMTAKLENGDQVDINDMICQWLSHGVPGLDELTRFEFILTAIENNSALVVWGR